MTDLSIPWRRCASCDRGRIVLFTSVDVCSKCFGTGIDLSDDRFAEQLTSLEVMVRTYKYFHRHGVDTLGDLLRFAAMGRMPECGSTDNSIFRDVLKLFERLRLPYRPHLNKV